MKANILNKIENREITVGVVGLGYVGLPLAVEKAKAGFKTIGFDVQEEKVKLVNEGHNYIGDVQFVYRRRWTSISSRISVMSRIQPSKSPDI